MSESGFSVPGVLSVRTIASVPSFLDMPLRLSMLPQADKSPGSPFSNLHKRGSGNFYPVVQVLCGLCGWYPDSWGAECSVGTVWVLCKWTDFLGGCTFCPCVYGVGGRGIWGDKATSQLFTNLGKHGLTKFPSLSV